MSIKINLLQLKEHGSVAEVKQDVVHVTGLTNCMNGQLVQIGEATKGVILGFDGEYVLVLVVQSNAAIKPGDRVTTKIDDFRVPVGEEFIGRQVNALAEPIDGKGSIKESGSGPIFAKAPTVLERDPLADVLATGVKIVDMTLPIGKGQRMLIIGDRMTGKTAVGVDAIINQKGKNVICIYCCIGKADASLQKVCDTFDRKGAWDYTIVVAALASDPMGQQYLSPYVACSLGEYFVNEKQADVLVVFDDFTKHAWAYRQISLLLERAPGRDAYPGDIFYIHSQLVERAGKLKPEKGGGTMTHLPIVETLQGDFAGYIPSNIISMTDGQIYLNSNLFGEGFKPAIDMGLSVSRIGSKVQWPAMKKPTGMLKLDFIRYKELEKLTRIKAGVSEEVEARLQAGRILEEVLKQDESVPVPLEDQVMCLYALQHGFLNGVNASDVRPRMAAFLQQLKTSAPDTVKKLVETATLSEDITEVLDEQIARFNPTV
ncbi:F0F1 ATP synthase subunit alpha [bacterium E08(2017)]|nr:F0F1 ATP synthase subunit alpha [bacterium E08(2017)]